MIDKISGTGYLRLRSQIFPLDGFTMLDKLHNFFGSQYPHQEN